MKTILLLFSMLLISKQLLLAAEIKEITPLTNRVILLHFTEGHVDYPNTLHVNRLDVQKASATSSYTLVSHEDADFDTPYTPTETGRKSKGMEFKKDAPWAGGSADPRSKPWTSEHWVYLMLDKPLKSGKSYTLNTGNLVTNGASWPFVFDEKTSRSEAVHVNTLGYAPEAPKFAYVYQWMGDKGNLNLNAYSKNKFYLYKDNEDEPVYAGNLKKRSNADNPETGQINDTPKQNFIGAEVYECDFTSVTAQGSYTLVVEEIGCSFPFIIGKDPVWEAYYHGARSLYHQRSGIRLAPPFTQADYIRPVNQNTKVTSDDGTNFAGKLLYCTLPWVEWDQGENGGSSQAAIRDASIGNNLDVAGWYHDAGDWDGYFSHQRIPILLMLTYEAVPQRFMDSDLNIPESGNGIPDIIDEASWLIKFNYRLRKELKTKGFSNGGVGGARVAADFFTSVDGSAESHLPSWKESRHTVVTNADAYMTYLYAGQAAQLAYIIKTIGKDPEAFAVEMLDHVEFEQMSYDTVNWIKEAEEAYAWASAPENQPSKHAHYSSELWVYQMYAAASLYRLTDKEIYHSKALSLLENINTKTRLEEDERFGVYTYLMADQADVNETMQEALRTLSVNNAKYCATDAAEKRGLRWGGVFDFPMLVGQATTPWMFEAMMAYAVTGEKQFANVVHTTADYFLGNNPLHTTWMTGVGPRPARGGFHLDSRYLWNNNWMTYPGFVPYGPWSMAYGYEPYKWTIDGVEMEGGQGTWNKDWANFSMYPLMHLWPGHERYNNNIHAPMSTENTIHQQSVYLLMAYGFVNNRNHSNKEAPVKIGSIHLNQSNLHFTKKGEQIILNATIDQHLASFPALKWSSSDQRIAHADAFGRVTAITKGTAVITVSTLDESVSAAVNVNCNWEEINVESISVSPKALEMVVGQKKKIEVSFVPENASNQFVDWSASPTGIIEIDETGTIRAMAQGHARAVAISLNGGKTDSCDVVVHNPVDYTIADFDTVVPVTTEPQTHTGQLYTPNGANDIAFENPMMNAANPSATVVKWERPAGDWKLIGMVLPTSEPQDLSKYAQFQFKYYGSSVREFLIQLISVDGGQIEVRRNVSGADAWQLFAIDLNTNLNLKQFNIFANPTGNPQASIIYMDDFSLAANAATPYNQTTISESQLALNSGESFILQCETEGHPFSWVSSNPDVATVDQYGKVNALRGGMAQIKAVPLYGEHAICEVIVDGGTPSTVVSEMIADFEEITLDWTQGYGAFAWASNVVEITENPSTGSGNYSAKTMLWKRDGTNLWAGCGLQFPIHNSTGWDNLSFQVYSSRVINNIRIEVQLNEEKVGEYTLNELGLEAEKWNTVKYEFSTMGINSKDFSRILFQVAGGSKEEMDVYFDNIKLNTKGNVPVDAIAISPTGTIEKIISDEPFKLMANISPTDATNKNIVWSSSNSNVVTVDQNGMVTIVGAGTALITATSVENPEISDQIWINVTDQTSSKQIRDDQCKVYPNPFGQELIFSKLVNVEKIEIISLSGMILQRVDVNGAAELIINASTFNPGLYFANIHQFSGRKTSIKIMKYK